MTWTNAPVSLSKAQNNHSYILYIDESGTPDLTFVRKEIQKGISAEMLRYNDRYLCLAGCVIPSSEHASLLSKVTDLKKKHWPPDGMHLHPKQKISMKVCLHNAEISRGRNFPFDRNTIDSQALKADLNCILSDTNMLIFAGLIDKYQHIQQYTNPYRAYDLLTECLLEKYAFFLNQKPSNEQGIVVFESRGKSEDSILHQKLIYILQNGSQYKPRTHFNRITGFYFNEKHTDCGTMTYCGLEIADLCTMPLKFALINYQQHGNLSNTDLAFIAIKNKIVGYPSNLNYGIKILP